MLPQTYMYIEQHMISFNSSLILTDFLSALLAHFRTDSDCNAKQHGVFHVNSILFGDL